MGRRGEPPIAVNFPVIVQGADSKGTPFVLTAETRDISCSGAGLKGLSGIVVSGKKVEVEYSDQRAWFRVQWAGAAGSSKAGQAGLRCLEPGKYIWGIPPKEWEPDSFDPQRPETASRGRRHPQCRRQEADHGPAVSGADSPGTPAGWPRKSRISLGGCYMEMLSPLPADTFVDISISPGDTTLQLSGRVLVPGEFRNGGYRSPGCGHRILRPCESLPRPCCERRNLRSNRRRQRRFIPMRRPTLIRPTCRRTWMRSSRQCASSSARVSSHVQR
jgi:hypothetical protein